MESGHARFHREAHDRGDYDWYSFDEMLAIMGRRFTKVHRSQLSGDIWSTDKTGEMADPDKLMKYISECNKNRFTPIMFSHKPIVGNRGELSARVHNLRVIKGATALCKDFTVNVSLEDMGDVDKAMDLGLDAVSVVPNRVYKKELFGPKVFTTPKGRKIVTCPAKYGSNGMNCTKCGNGRPLCTRKGRDYAIGFPATGGARKALNILS